MNKGKSYACRDRAENNLREGDFYPTPKSCVFCAADFFHKIIPLNEVITEPCCAGGSITKALKEIGYSGFIENDLYNPRKDIYHEDILKSSLAWSSSYVVTNFPFSIWDSCVLAFLASKNVDAVITIGRLNYLSTQSRLQSPLWKHLHTVNCFSRYIDYRTPERDDGQFNVGAMASGWFYFTKEEVEHPIIEFCDVQKYATLGNIKE